jgi:hypothetical protein
VHTGAAVRAVVAAEVGRHYDARAAVPVKLFGNSIRTRLLTKCLMTVNMI